MSEKKIENRNKRKEDLPGPPLPCAAQQQQAGPARRRPSPPGPSSVVFLPDSGTARADARAPPRLHLLLPLATSCFLLVAWNAPDDATQPRPPSHSLPPPLPLLSLSHPRTTAAADGHHRSHRLSHAFPTRSPAPPRRQLPPRRATQAGVPRGAVAVAKFDSGRRGSSLAIRELPGIPDLALALAGSAVSPRTEPPPPRVRSRRPGLSSAMAEARLRSNLSPALLRRPFGHASAPSTLAAPRSAPLAF